MYDIKSLLVICIFSKKKNNNNNDNNNKNLQCDAPYRGHPTNIFYKLANQGTRI